MYDPYDPQVQADPYPSYERLRREAPVYQNESLGFWALSRFGDVLGALHDPVTFSSASGITIGTSADVLLPMMSMRDPPRHDRLRALVSRAFTPRSIAALEPRVVEIAEGFADDIWNDGGGDLVKGFTEALPTQVIAEMLGVDPGDRAFFKERSNQLVRANPLDRSGRQQGLEAATALYSYLGGVIEERRSAPRDDLISSLLGATVDGERLTDDELVGFCFLLLVAGNETTTNLLGNALVALDAHPWSRHAVEKRELGLPAVVEEVVRFESPVQGLARTTTSDVVVGDSSIPAGSSVLLLFASANRDEAEFPDPDRFDPSRRLDRHLGFGHGIHHCLGAALARLEARAGLACLLDRRPRYELCDSPVDWLDSGLVRGPRTLVATVT